MIRPILRITLLVLLGLYFLGLDYPVHYYPDGSYGCAGAFEINTRESEPWDALCAEQQQAPSCALAVIEYRINNNITLICRKAYQ